VSLFSMDGRIVDNSVRPSRRVGRTVFGRLKSRFTGQLMGRCLAAPNTYSGNWNQAGRPSGGPAPIPKRKHRRKFTCIAACRVQEAPAFRRANRDACPSRFPVTRGRRAAQKLPPVSNVESNSWRLGGKRRYLPRTDPCPAALCSLILALLVVSSGTVR
jgi:hypothetical protein